MQTVRLLLEGKPRALYTVDAENPVRAAIQLMADHHVGALPVMRGAELAGIISERDYARKVVLLGRNSTETLVWQIMTTPVTTVGLDDSVQRCMKLMTEMRFRHLPVVDAGMLTGMISIGDCVRAVMEAQQHEIDELKRYIAT
jgi:CBS domain-containing protein